MLSGSYADIRAGRGAILGSSNRARHTRDCGQHSPVDEVNFQYIPAAVNSEINRSYRVVRGLAG